MENAEYTLAEFRASTNLIKIFFQTGIDRYVWANIHYYIELYKIKESLAILIQTRYFGSRINNKKFLIAKFYCETKQQKYSITKEETEIFYCKFRFISGDFFFANFSLYQVIFF